MKRVCKLYSFLFGSSQPKKASAPTQTQPQPPRPQPLPQPPRPPSPPKTAAEQELERLERLRRGLALNLAMNPGLANNLDNQIAMARRLVMDEKKRIEQRNQSVAAVIGSSSDTNRKSAIVVKDQKRVSKIAKTTKTQNTSNTTKTVPSARRRTRESSPEGVMTASNEKQYRELRRLGVDVEPPK